jgi:beta-lactamase class D
VKKTQLILILAIALILVGLVLTFSGCRGQRHEVSVPMGLDNPFWAKDFADLGIQGTFVLYDPATQHWQFHNKARADSAFSPASTFKIFNSLVGLQEKAVANDSVVLPWDRVVRGWEKWDMDQSMKTAFKYSCVWYYQEIARRVGEKRMQYWLSKVGYGNREMGAAVDSFWLNGSLKITALEQVEFLFALEANDLPFPKPIQENVKRIMVAEEGDGWKLYGKTGWGDRKGRQIGWYVGFIRSGAERRIFAMNMDIHEDEEAQYRLAMTRKILKKEGLMPGAE